jgi:tetratricopeptide (TPR) repeat protein
MPIMTTRWRSPVGPRILPASRVIISSAIIGVAALALPSAVQAYSDEAVKDAAGLLERTTTRFKFGEVLRPDVALAGYNLLDMKYKAEKLSAAAFCRAAKADLSIVAKTFEGTKEQAGEKKKWLAAIAGMTASRAECKRASELADSLLFDAKPPIYSDAAEKAARDMVDATTQRSVFGEVVTGDVMQAKYDLLAVRYAGKKISRATYCQIGVVNLLELATSVEGEANLGQRTLADVIAARRRFYSAKAACGADLHGDPKALLTLQRSAGDHLAQKQYEGAIEDFTALIKLSPQNAEALNGRAVAYEGKADHDHAIADFTAAIQIDPSDAKALDGRGDARYGKSDFSGAIADYSAVLKLHPDDVGALSDRGNAFYAAKNLAQAIADYSKALELGPKQDPLFRFRAGKSLLASRGLAHLTLGQWDDAIADYDAALKSDSRFATALYGRGLGRTRKGDAAGGEADMAAAKALQADVAEAFAGVKVN